MGWDLTLEQAIAEYREAATREAQWRVEREVAGQELEQAKAKMRKVAETHQQSSQALGRALKNLGEAVR